MSERQLPKWSEIKPLLRVRPVERNATSRRLARAMTIADLRTAARGRVPRAVFDYTDGAAEGELSLLRARRMFQTLEFSPSVLHDVSGVDTSTTVLGRTSAFPFAFAPTGFTRLMHHEGECAVARVAERHGIPYALSTMGTTSIEDVAAAAHLARRWFQLYVWKDRGAGEALMMRAGAAGYEALILTVDVPVAGNRLRDARNGFSIPPTLTVKTVADIATHPAWWANLLTTAPLTFASLSGWHRTIAELIDELFDPNAMTMQGPRVGPVLLAGAPHRQGHPVAGRRTAHGGRKALTRSCCPTTGGGSWIERRYP